VPTPAGWGAVKLTRADLTPPPGRRHSPPEIASLIDDPVAAVMVARSTGGRAYAAMWQLPQFPPSPHKVQVKSSVPTSEDDDHLREPESLPINRTRLAYPAS
jgi:hypothetical protein